MISPVFRIHLPHLFWFLFGCRPSRVVIDSPGEIGRVSRIDTQKVMNREERIKVPGEGEGRVVAVGLQVWCQRNGRKRKQH